MLKGLSLFILLCICITAASQPGPVKKNNFRDSMEAVQWKEVMGHELPVIALNEDLRNENNTYLPSLLTANRDVLMNMAGFHFNIVRFRLRGYDGSYFNTQINGISMNSPEEGTTQWGLWGGLNDVTRNVQTSMGLRAADFAFGNIGNTVHIDMRASKQRVQTQAGYAFSNRSYTHRYLFTHNSGMNKKGWSYAISGSIRYAAEGYMPGTFYRGGSYFMAVDKRLNERGLLSIIVFGAPLVTGKQSPVLEESTRLLQTRRYNAYWGYQAGRKRNANMGLAHQPVVIISYEHRANNHSSWITSLGGIWGDKTNTGLDWYKAADPRPDYYRYLPSYQKDPVLQTAVADAIKKNSSLQQINWDGLIEVNRHSNETVIDANGIAGNNITGHRSHYIVEERVSAVKRVDASTVFHSLVASDITFTGGISFQFQQSRNYKKVNDLLGGDFYVDWNQFAERDFPAAATVWQNDLNRPNRLLNKGDAFGYDYLIQTTNGKGWAQIALIKKRIDYFAAAEIAYTNYQRNGLVQNGLFPDNSLGKSVLTEFTDYAVKTGITYKISGRKYVYAHLASLTKAPAFADVFVAPRTRDTRQETITAEKIATAEIGYIWNAPRVKFRLSGYLTQFSDGMTVSTFYHDGYGNFVNYALSGINKQHAGIEWGMEIALSAKWMFSLATSLGRYYYNSRQLATVSVDNDAYVIERAVVYSKNFRVAGTPQEAYGTGISYQSGGSFYLNLSSNYFAQHWLSFNPLRRTYTALQGVVPGTDQWNRVVAQTQLPIQYTLDLSLGGAVKLPQLFIRHRGVIHYYISINNLLNNQNMVSGGYEQARFDADTKNLEKFPPKFFYGMGINFSGSLTLRL